MAFRFALLGYLVLVLVLYLPFDWTLPGGGAAHTALVRVEGVIKRDAPASAEHIVGGLRTAFEDENTRAVVVYVDSPGGSAVQAARVSDEMHRLRAAHPSVPLYAVIGDIGASGGYYIAAAADRVYAAPASLVGSIGVVLPGFGFVGAMDKLGIERRLLTAGAHKGFLDPFSPSRKDEEAHVRTVLAEVHAQFIDAVRRGRGDRLRETPELFSGLIWSGNQSLELGLIDGFGSVASIARDVVEAEDVVDFTVREGLITRIGRRIGTAAVGAVTELAARAAFPSAP